MTRNKMREYMALAMAVMATLSVSADGRNHYLNKLRQSGGWTFYTDAGASVPINTVKADAGCDVTTVDMITDTPTLSHNLDFHSWTIARTNATTSMTGPWCDGNGIMTLRGGGLAMSASHLFRFGHRDNAVRVNLAESQAWSGPATGTAWAEFAIGCNNSYQGRYYWDARIQALTDLAWTLDGRIRVVMSASNDLSNVDVVVNPCARLILVGRWSSQTANAHLNAKSLTLKGGDSQSSVPLFTIGAQNPDTTSFGSTSYAPSAFDDATVSPKVYLLDGASITGGTVDYGVSKLFVVGGDSTFSGAVTLKKNVAIDIASGASLAFTGSLGTDCDACITLTGDGTFVLDVASSVHIAADCTAVKLVGEGAWEESLAGASGITISSPGAIYLGPGALAGFSGSEISVEEGTLVLENGASLPSGCRVVTSGGASLVIVDPTGFDADARMGGTKSLVSDSFVIGETPRENESISVPDGQVMRVFGSGLKASSTVEFQAGASLVFFKTAAIAAPISTAGRVVVSSVVERVEGTIAGGLEVKSGSGVHQYVGRIVMRDGAVPMTGSYTIHSGRTVMTNCTVTGGKYLNVYADSGGDSCLEIAKGCELTIAANNYIQVGKGNAHESRLLINGGTLRHYDSILVDTDNTGIGVIELAAGRLVSRYRIRTWRGAHSSKFIWSGGEWHGSAYKNGHLFEGYNASCGFDVVVSGTNCVLDLSSFDKAAAITNFYQCTSTMTGVPGAKLTVKGKSGVAAKLTLANFTPNGLALDLNQTPNADVEIVGAGADVELGWVVPGNGGRVRCVGTASPLLANYVVPGGTTFENAYVNGDWNSGFSSVTTNDLVFWDGSTYLLRPTALGLAPLEIAGSVVASGTVRYAVDKSVAPLPAGEGIAVVNAVEGSSGDGTWTAASEMLGRRTRVYGDESGLRLDYDKQGALIIVF